MDKNPAACYPPPPPPLQSAHYPAYYQPPPPPVPSLATLPPPPHLSYTPQQLPPASVPASFASYVAAYVPHVTQNHVRTLFVAGLPEDVKPREIYNLFREFPGYESSHLRSPSEGAQPFAFVTFVDQITAIAALHALNGMVFDLEKGSALYIDLAKSNSRSKRPRTDDHWSSTDKKARGSSGYSTSTSELGIGSVNLPGMGNSAYNTIGYPPAQSHGNLVGGATKDSAAAKLNNSSAPPCPTLFVANLGPNCTERELSQVFSRCPGFLKLKMQGTYGTPVAFVDFQDTACSTEALSHLQGTVLDSSPAAEGMRLEYAKSRMGMRRKPR